ncbi:MULTISPECIES: hypothetical protein [Myxococcus]|uniref:hypothetical protein n=1 Tax=Myxococcus TaxID=32 RepID=UPI001376489D|nr:MULTISPECIES: hypothetical protein [Myxococcus]WAM28214.1 hypothetical protein OZ403_08805 [Myxococcus sp. NMCA1]
MSTAPSGARRSATRSSTAVSKGKRGDELPEELRRAQTRLQRIREARQALEAEARGAA